MVLLDGILCSFKHYQQLTFDVLVNSVKLLFSEKEGKALFLLRSSLVAIVLNIEL